jgi:hypothetical protein
MNQFLNLFFFFFHTSFTLFNCFGWIWKKTRRWNLFTLLLTAFSWFFLGIWFGWGYCLCTDWHWEVREKLGYHDQSVSYIHFLILKITGINFDPGLVDKFTVSLFFLSVVLSIGLNIRDYRRDRLK